MRQPHAFPTMHKIENKGNLKFLANMGVHAHQIEDFERQCRHDKKAIVRILLDVGIHLVNLFEANMENKNKLHLRRIATQVDELHWHLCDRGILRNDATYHAKVECCRLLEQYKMDPSLYFLNT